MTPGSGDCHGCSELQCCRTLDSRWTGRIVVGLHIGVLCSRSRSCGKLVTANGHLAAIVLDAIHGTIKSMKYCAVCSTLPANTTRQRQRFVTESQETEIYGLRCFICIFYEPMHTCAKTSKNSLMTGNSNSTSAVVIIMFCYFFVQLVCRI